MANETNLTVKMNGTVEGYFKTLTETYEALQQQRRKVEEHHRAYDANWELRPDERAPMSNAELDWHNDLATLEQNFASAEDAFIDAAARVAVWWTLLDIPF